MVLHRVATVVLPLCCCPLYASDQATELDQIIVTATRTARTADETLASVTVITREEIERRQATSVQEVLRGVPGLGISNSGGLGKTTSVFLRGTNSDHVLVLIDGIRIGSVTLGTAAFQDIPIDQVERIEIVRGPRSSLYGSEAIGGVIQIFTRKGGGKPTPNFSVAGGSHATYKLAGGVSGGAGPAWYSVNASHLDTQGFNACNGSPFPLPFGQGCGVFEFDDDGYRNSSGSVRAGYRFDNGVELEGHLLHAEGHNEFDGSFLNNNGFVQQAVGGKLRLSPVANWDVTLLGGRSLDESENFLNGASMSVFDTERVSASLQNDITLAANHLLTVGFDYYNDLVDSTEAFAVTSRDDKAGFAQYQGAFDGHDVVLGIRHDDNEQFGGRTTGNVAWGYTFGDYLRLTAAWGMAFKAPTFNQLFFLGFGNPNLKPEDSESWEVGASGRFATVRWSLNGYYTEVDQLIGIAPSGTSAFTAVNIDEARILGLEAIASTTLWSWEVGANLSLLDPENRGEGPNQGKLLPRRAQAMFRLDLDRRFGPLLVGATAYGEGRRFDDLTNTQRLGGYVTVDLRAGVELHKNWILEGRVSNLLDKDYETARLFNQDDRNFFVTLRYVPDAI
jgi:vitamin B12 transporter